MKANVEVVVIAIGSSPLIPKIAGIEAGMVATAIDVLSGSAEVGQSTVIIGGGSVGCETAEFLAAKGIKVTLVEMIDTLATDEANFSRMMLLERLENLDVKLLTKLQAREVKPGKLVASDAQGNLITIVTDSIVLATGARSNNSLYKELIGKVKELYQVGDCAAPGKIFDAMHGAAEIAYKL